MQQASENEKFFYPHIMSTDVLDNSDVLAGLMNMLASMSEKLDECRKAFDAAKATADQAILVAETNALQMTVGHVLFPAIRRRRDPSLDRLHDATSDEKLRVELNQFFDDFGTYASVLHKYAPRGAGFAKRGQSMQDEMSDTFDRVQKSGKKKPNIGGV